MGRSRRTALQGLARAGTDRVIFLVADRLVLPPGPWRPGTPAQRRFVADLDHKPRSPVVAIQAGLDMLVSEADAADDGPDQ